MMAVFQPARASVVESGPPDWPAPIIIASYCSIVMSFFLPSFAFYFLLYRLNYPGFVTTTRDSIYNFLDNYSGLLAACGQYHLNKEKFAKGGIRMILEKRKIFDGQKDMISTLDLE